MNTFTKEEARRIVLGCAKDYNANLLNKKFIIIYKNHANKCFEFIELLFLKRNFQHLTGLELVDENNNIQNHRSEYFYEKCINQKLSADDFQFKKDGTTNLKLQALPKLIKIHRVTKIAGEYNHNRPYLVVDKVVGGVNFCLGINYDKDCFVPVSTLMENIKSLASCPHQVIAILKKDVADDIYENICHVSKGVNLHNCFFEPKIANIINLQNYQPKK